MTAPEDCLQLAELIVEALEVGSGKQEWDVIDEVCDAFGISFKEIDSNVPKHQPGRAAALRRRTASRLAEATVSAPALLNVLVRCGGRFVAMLDATYERLARHARTTTGSSETFRLARAGVDETQLTISPAFIERVRQLSRMLSTLQLGRIDDEALGSFILPDGGELYGTWPLRNRVSSIRLADALLNLAWLRPLIEARAAADPTAACLTILWDDARAAGERLVAVAESLVRSHMTHLDLLADVAVDQAQAAAFLAAVDPWTEKRRAGEIQSYRDGHVLGTTVYEIVSTIVEPSLAGLNERGEDIVIASAFDHPGAGASALAGFVSMWHRGLWSRRRKAELEDRLNSPKMLASWLVDVTAAATEATAWLEHDVLTVDRTIEVSSLSERIEEYLNLPMWRQRHLLYEIWVLCAVLDASEAAGWISDLNGLALTNGVWVLSVGRTDTPVARLTSQDGGTHLEVWREPARETATGLLTPDVAVSTPGPLARDLLVVEAKDRVKMAAGRPQHSSEAPTTAFGRTALGVATRYAEALHPAATWLCNHCEFRQPTDPTTNHGDAWTRIHLADRFRPGEVPAAFLESVRIALRIPAVDPQPSQIDEDSGLILIVDVTGSMAGSLEHIVERLEALVPPAFNAYRAVLFRDHGEREPFLVKTLGPFRDLEELTDAIRGQPCDGGGDVPEALEDALQQAREIVEAIGPQTLLVITDAPSHEASECPNGIDFRDELRALLSLGCVVQVLNIVPARVADWDAFFDHDGFQFDALEALAQAWPALDVPF